MTENKKCCGTCNYGYCDELQDYICVNDESDYVTDYVDYNHCCDEYVPEIEE